MILWRDAYRYKGKRPTGSINVLSWGKVDEITDEGIALIQNEVQKGEHDVERIMDGQYIPKDTILEIKKL